MNAIAVFGAAHVYLVERRTSVGYGYGYGFPRCRLS